MIAGSTPVCYFFLNDSWRVPMIAIQWVWWRSASVADLFFRAPRVVFTAIYLITGWLLILPIQQVLAAMTATQQTLLWAVARHSPRCAVLCKPSGR